jgi:hypothetical protein
VKALKQEEVESQELRRVQANLADFVQPLVKNPLLDGVLLRDVALAAGVNVISHGLARAPQGWLVVAPNADVRVWTSASSNPSPTGRLMLEASASCTLSLFVF